MVLPIQITGQKAKRQRDENCQSEAAEKVLKEAGNQSLGAYIDKWQATVAEWVALKPILEIFDKETGYEGGGRRREPWWRKTVDQKQLSATLKEILAAARARHWKSGRRGEGGGGRDVAESESDAGSDGPQYSGTETGDD